MWVRDLETGVQSIVGASGCFFAARRVLHGTLVPEALSRDFAAALIAREQGYEAVSVKEAICRVPRTPSLRREYRRKVRTITRGMETLYYQASLARSPTIRRVCVDALQPQGACRWLVPWAGLGGLVGLRPARSDRALGSVGPCPGGARGRSGRGWMGLAGGAPHALAPRATCVSSERQPGRAPGHRARDSRRLDAHLGADEASRQRRGCDSIAFVGRLMRYARKRGQPGSEVPL